MMIKGTGQHLQPGTGLLVKGPKTYVIMPQIGCEGAHRLVEQPLCQWFAGSKEVVIDTPTSPNKAIQDMSGRGDNIFLEPGMTTFIHVYNTTLIYGVQEGRKGPQSRIQIGGTS